MKGSAASKEILRYLEDVSDGNALENARRKADEAGLQELASATPKALFHSGDGFSPPAGIAVAKDGRIFVSDEFNHRVLVYSPEFKIVGEAGSQGSGDGQFRYPRGLTLDEAGNLYVADAWNHRVVLFDPGLEFMRNIGSLGDGEGQLDEPVGVTFFNGYLCVLEKSNHRIQAFEKDGRTAGSLGKRGSVNEQADFYLAGAVPESFSRPVFEFPSAFASDGAGNLYIADTNNHRVLKIDSMWNDDSSFRITGIRYPIGIACDDGKNVHLTEFNREGVSVFSPGGVLLYRYVPKDIKTPIALGTGGGMAFIGGGITAGISAVEVKAAHDRGVALEKPFSHSFKEALAALRDGDFAYGVEGLSLAAEVPEKPDADGFSTLLPENDYSFGVPRAKIEKNERADGFIKIAAAYREETLDWLDTALNEKLGISSELNRVSLQLEKALLSGSDNAEGLVVERFRVTKKFLTSSSAIKKRFHNLKKMDEFLRRLAAAGLGTEARLDQIIATFDRFTRWKVKRDGMYSRAERLAPALSFASSPEERTEFAENESGLSAVLYEFNLIWRVCAEYNREVASLSRGAEGVSAEKILLKAVDFFAFCQEGFKVRLDYLLSLEELMESFSLENLSAIIKGFHQKAFWNLMAREDNIAKAATGSPYGLMPALWADECSEQVEEVQGDTWEKIVDFYHHEFRRFIAENSPLCTEYVRNEQMRPIAEKADPKQAAILNRKAGLLGFHRYFQERYIGNLIGEYMVRFALFALSKNPLPKAQIDRTEKEVEKLFAEVGADRSKAEFGLGPLYAKLPETEGIGEKNKLSADIMILELASSYYEYLGQHLRIIRGRMAKSAECGAEKIRRRAVFNGPESVSAPFRAPVGLAFGENGNLYALSRLDVSVCILGANGRYAGSFGGYGNIEGKLIAPIDIAVSPDGSLAVADIDSRVVSFFSPDGKFLRRFALEEDEGRKALAIDFDSRGRIFASFFDGKGISIYAADGKKSGVVDTASTAFQPMGKLLGFAIKDDRIIAAGRGKIIMTDLDGLEIKSFTDTETAAGFDDVLRITADDIGNVFASDYANNILLHVDAGFTSVQRLGSANTLAASPVAARNGVLAVGDFIAHRILFFDIAG